RFAEIAARYPEIPHDQHHVDIMAARMVMSPEIFDVIVASNLFGDILSDLGPGLAGTSAVAPSANINPARVDPSVFDAGQGSAPDIAGRGIANPVGQIWSAAMMLDHLGEVEAGAMMLGAIERALADPSAPKTPDLGGSATTTELGQAIAAHIS